MKSIPSRDLPAAFVERQVRQLGAPEATALVATLEEPPVRALRANPGKIGLVRVTRRLQLAIDPVPWCVDATYLPADARPGDSVEHRAGWFYLQEPSSMAVVAALDIQPHHRVLDLAAAPGGKATHAASCLGDEGFLLVNELVTTRLGPLLANLDAWGYPNTAVASTGPDRLADAVGAMFDRVIVDAPCSGEALFRRDPASRTQWTEAGVRGAARRQRKLLAAAMRTVRAGGRLAYSTCTFGTEENEERVADALADHPGWTLAEPPHWPGVDRVEIGGYGQALRFYPHHCRCEGQFVAILQAPASIRTAGRTPSLARGQAAPWEAFARATLRRRFDPARVVERADTYYSLPAGINLPPAAALRPGLLLGRVLGVTFKPSHALAMTLRPEDVTAYEDLDGEDLRAFRSGVVLQRTGPSGWVLATVEGWPIGWAHRRGDSLTPHLPSHSRARAA